MNKLNQIPKEVEELDDSMTATDLISKIPEVINL